MSPDQDHEDESSLDDFDELDDEFSLDKLSKAYADVVRQRDSADKDENTATDPKQVNGDKNTTQPPSPPPATEDASPEKLLADDNRGCPIEPATIIESIVFVGTPRGTPLTLKAIAAVLRDVNPDDVATEIATLNDRYQSQNSAFRIVIQNNDEGSEKVEAATKDALYNENAEVTMVLADTLDAFSNDYFGRNKQVQLSQASIDVMAVVAYHQPISKADVEKTRGKPSGTVLAQLVRRDLLQLTDVQSKPVKKAYETTQRFLDLFQLSNVEDLPQSHDVSEFEEYID